MTHSENRVAATEQEPSFIDSSEKKRKRPLSTVTRKKTVCFNLETQVILTYSSIEYDRGGIFANPTLYKLNPALAKPKPSPPRPKLSVDIHACANIPRYCDAEDEDGAGLSGDSTCSSASAQSLDTPSDECSVDFFRSTADHIKAPSEPCFPIVRPPRPSLSIDTSMCTGASVFTLKTRRTFSLQQRTDINDGGDDFEDPEDTASPFLVPMSAVLV